MAPQLFSDRSEYVTWVAINDGVVRLARSGRLSEQGQVVLVAADPSEHREIASFQALEGKTWNHPVLAGDCLYVRNSQEAAAYRIQLN